jgi:hypothetical protein
MSVRIEILATVQKKSKFCLFHQNILFKELFQKIIFKSPGEFFVLLDLQNFENPSDGRVFSYLWRSINIKLQRARLPVVRKEQH